MISEERILQLAWREQLNVWSREKERYDKTESNVARVRAEKAWEELLEQMNDYEKGHLITGIEDGWINPNMDDWHIYCKLKGIDEHPILTWLKKIVKAFVGK